MRGGGEVDPLISRAATLPPRSTRLWLMVRKTRSFLAAHPQPFVIVTRKCIMQQLDLVIHNSTGLHARPARVFVDLAKQYQSAIKIRYGAKQVNAKSLISVLTLGVPTGQRIQIDVSGDDEELAAAAITAAVRDGLGEGPATNGHAPAEAAAPAAPPQRTSAPAAPLPQGALEPGAVVRGTVGAPGIAVGPVFRFEREH